MVRLRLGSASIRRAAQRECFALLNECTHLPLTFATDRVAPQEGGGDCSGQHGKHNDRVAQAIQCFLGVVQPPFRIESEHGQE